MLASKIRSTLWFLKRPALYPQLLHLAWDRLTQSPEADASDAAAQWCEGRAIGWEKAIEAVAGKAAREKVEILHAAEFAKAIDIEKSCPEWMGGPGDLNLLFHAVTSIKAKKVVETGVAYGWSSLAILLGMEGRDDARLVSSDMPYVQGKNDPYVGCVVFEPRWRKKWQLVKKADRQVLPDALKDLGQIDLCHYDSDKSYRGRMWAYPLLWRSLRSGGLFISDDINDNFAFRDFAAQLKIEPVVVLVENERHRKFVGLIRKP